MRTGRRDSHPEPCRPVHFQELRLTTQPTSIRLTDRLKDKLKSWAADENRSFAGHCAHLLAECVKWRETQKQGTKK